MLYLVHALVQLRTMSLDRLLATRLRLFSRYTLWVPGTWYLVILEERRYFVIGYCISTTDDIHSCWSLSLLERAQAFFVFFRVFSSYTQHFFFFLHICSNFQTPRCRFSSTNKIIVFILYPFCCFRHHFVDHVNLAGNLSLLELSPICCPNGNCIPGKVGSGFQPPTTLFCLSLPFFGCQRCFLGSDSSHDMVALFAL